MRKRLTLPIVLALLSPGLNVTASLRTEVITYHDDKAAWVVGQISSRSINGITVQHVSYDYRAMPHQIWSFGKLSSTTNYDALGNVSSVVDGNGHTTAFGNWKRGIPSIVQFADSTSINAVVNDQALVTSVMNEAGDYHNFQYDALGRLARTQFPSGDNVAWNAIYQSFTRSSAPAYGLPAGHWQQILSIGSHQKIVYFDGLWRPVLTREFDSSNEQSSQRFQRFEYDQRGRVSFSSYLSPQPQVTAGVRTTYDAIGRVVSQSESSEIGELLTTTYYPSGLTAVVVNPRGVQTQLRYIAWDQPTFEYPIQIDQGAGHPERAITDIARDAFGKTTTIRRRDAADSLSVARHYVYDEHQQLCKSVEPETGPTVMSYDGAGNLSWSAAGLQGLTALDQCNFNEAYASGRRVDRTYDGRNRVLSVRFPDGLGNIENWYTPTGLLSQTKVDNGGTGIATTVYTHNKRGMVVGEAMGVGDVAWGIGYGFDGNGNLMSNTHSVSGLRIDYVPNALGQATRANGYALGASYFPNGALKQFSYGNGATHTLTQNARGLPERSRDSIGGAVLHDDSLDYDAHGNVAAISDGRLGSRGDRTMQYDALDRLTQTISSMFGTASYSYDALDNLRSLSVSAGSQARQRTYAYDASNKLVSLHAPNGGVVSSLTYDPQGNLATKDGRSYQFDYGNRLRAVADVEAYRYDGHGRRVQSIRGGRGIYSIYGHDGVLRFQRDEHRGLTNEYIYLSGSQVARIETPIQIGVPQLAVSSQSATGNFAVSWSAVPLASRYELEEWKNGGPWTQIGSSAALSVDLSRPGGNYGYRVRACAAVCGAWSNEGWLEVSIPPPAPTLIAPSSSSTGNYTVSWGGVAGASGYELEERVGSGQWAQVYSGSGSNRAFTGKVNGQYAYRARACSASCGAWSSEASVQVAISPPTVPSLTAPATSDNGDYSVSWTASSGASRYELEERFGSGAWAHIYSGSDTARAIAGRTGGSYYYRVRACAADCSAWSPEAHVSVALPPPPAPSLSVPATSANGSFIVSWTASSGAHRYEVEERLVGADWSQVYGGPNLSLPISGRLGGSHSYRGRACSERGCGEWSAVVTVIVAPQSAPNLTVSASVPTSTISASWSSVVGAAVYVLAERNEEGAWTIVHESAETSRSFTRQAGSSYTYRVQACNTGGCGAWSALATVNLPAAVPAAPVITAPSNSENGAYTVSWTAPNGSSSYHLEEQIVDGVFGSLYQGSATQLAITGRASGTYRYRAKACSESGCSVWSAIASVNVLQSPAPTLSVPRSRSPGDFTVSWTPVTGASSGFTYTLDEQANGDTWSTWSTAYQGTQTSSVMTGRDLYTSFTYRVRYCNASGCGAWSQTKTIQGMIPPPGNPVGPGRPVTRYAGSESSTEEAP